MKSQPTEWEKRLANHIFNEDLAFRTYKEFSQLNVKKTKN